MTIASSTRRFTRAELLETITSADLAAMPEADQAAYNRQLFALWMGEDPKLSRDYDRVASDLRGEIGT